jgi:hypothetical protein
VEQSAAADRLELRWVADEYDPPALHGGEGGEGGEAGEGGCGDHHAGLVDEHGSARREPVAGRWRQVSALPLVEELGERVRDNTGLAFEGMSGLCRRGDPEHAAIVPV